MKTENINKMFKHRGLKKSKAIEICKVSRRTFYNYVNGETTAPDDFVILLANFLGTPIDYIK